MKTFRVPVTMDVLVTIDEAKFDEAFLAEYRRSFYSFFTLEEHVRHLAQLQARAILSGTFVEGYGDPADMGIEAEADDRAASFEVGDPDPVPTPDLHKSLIEARRHRKSRIAS